MTIKEALEVLRKKYRCRIATRCPDSVPVNSCNGCDFYTDSSNITEALKTVLENFPTEMSGTSDNCSEKPNDCDMTLDEAIQHAEDVAKAKNDEAEEARLQEQDKYADECIKCATEHRQLAEWLGELAVLREKVNHSELPNSSGDLIDRAEAQTELQFVARRYTVAKEAHGEGQVVWSENLISVTDAMNALRKVPSVQVGQKKGGWIVTSEFEDCRYVNCNQCKVTQVFYCNKPLTNFCPNCGAFMRGDTE